MLRHIQGVGRRFSAAWFISMSWVAATADFSRADTSDARTGRVRPGMEAIRSALDSKTELELVETPLTDVIDYLKTRHGIEIQIDRKALEDDNMPLDTPITKNLKGITLRSALRLILRDLDLKYLIRDGALLITTKDVADSTLEVRAHPVRDLLPKEVHVDDYKVLVNAISPCAVARCALNGNQRQPWVRAMPCLGAIVVCDTQEGHEKIDGLLAGLRKARERLKQ